MAGLSKIAKGFETIIKASANLVATLQIGVNKILWGSGNIQPIQTVEYVPSEKVGTGRNATVTSGSLNYKSNIPKTPTPPSKAQSKVGKKITSLANTGLFNALDALNSVDLCNVITYLTDNINIKRRQRPNKPWNTSQAALYGLQDVAKVTQTYIDKYTAFPNTFVGSYTGFGLDAQTLNQAAAQSQAPVQGGTAVSAYNTYFLLQAITDTLGPVLQGTGSFFTAEEKTLISSVPGLIGNVNILNDFLGTAQKYTSYTQINNQELVKLQNKIATIRSVCVVVQTLDFKSTLALVGNFLNTDVRSQIQKLTKFLDPTKITPTLKEINSAIRSFIRIANQVQGIVRTAQFIIKLGLLFYKVFKFILYFFRILPLPSMFQTAGTQVTIQNASDAAKNESDGIVRILSGVNALLSVVLVFVRYLLANANELLIRLQTLLANLEICEAMKDSEVLLQLQQTYKDLEILRDELANYVINFDSKSNPNTTLFGTYEIRVVEEELADTSIENRRRRGIALDPNGRIVTSSDLTFATNTQVIIGEVKQKLVALGLIRPGLANLDGANLEVISESINYLDNNDVLADDLNISADTLDSIAVDAPENVEEGKGLGLNAFINNLKGGKRLRKRVRAALSKATDNVKTQITKEKQASGRIVP